MSNNKTDVEELLETIALMSENQIERRKSQPETSMPNQIKVVVLAFILASIIPVGGLVYQLGAQREEILGRIKNSSLEIDTKFTKELSLHKEQIRNSADRFRDNIRDIERTERDTSLAVKGLEERMREAEDSKESCKRQLDDMYRTVTYLKSQHSINMPPDTRYIR